MPKVRFLNEVVEVEARPNETISECAERNGITLFRGFWTFGHKYVFCPGSGICGSCRVWVNELSEGAVPPRTKKERHRLGEGSTARYACSTPILGDLEIRTQPNGPIPAQSAEWPADSRPSKWKTRLVEKEAALASGGAALDDEAEAEAEA